MTDPILAWGSLALSVFALAASVGVLVLQIRLRRKLLRDEEPYLREGEQ